MFTNRSILRGPIFAALVALGSGAQAEDRLVPDTYSTIQAGINAALDGDRVLVAPGTYVETIDLLGKAITVQSTSGPRATIIDGNAAGPVVSMISGEGFSGPTLFSGFTVTNGLSNEGGGIQILDSSPSVHNCIIRNNVSTGDGGGLAIGRQFFTIPRPRILNCVLIDNLADGYGGGISSRDNAAYLANCTVVGNFAGAQAGGLYYGLNANTYVINFIIWDNAAEGAAQEMFDQSSFSSFLAYSLVKDCGGSVGWWEICGTLDVGGNIAGTPRFVDPIGSDGLAYSGDEDLNLLPGSPGIDMGCSQAIDPGLSVDADLQPRHLDDINMPDSDAITENCAGPFAPVDLGAYEFQATSSVGCRADVDRDGSVGLSDLALVLANFGRIEMGFEQGDLDDDAIVTLSDLAELLALFGRNCN